MPIRILSSSNAPRSRDAIVFCADHRFLPFAAFAAARIDRMHPDRGFDIVVASMEDIQLPPSLDDVGIRACRIDTDGLFADFRVDTRRTPSVYLRLALPDAFADDYDRILYLDGDIFVQRCGLDALLAVDMRGFPVCAVRDAMQWRHPARRAKPARALGWRATKFLNSGALLIDPEGWRAADLTGQAVSLGRTMADRLGPIGHDQTLLNGVLMGEWGELHPTWNWQHTRRVAMLEAMTHPRIVHFVGAVKPWNDPGSRMPPRFADGMAPFMDRHFPDAPTDWPTGRPIDNPREMAFLAYRSRRMAPVMARYLNRFRSELDVL